MTILILHVVFVFLVVYGTKHDPENDGPCGYD